MYKMYHFSNTSSESDKIIVLWSPLPFPASHQFEYELIRQIRRIYPFCCISCCRGFSDLSLYALKHSHLILILLPDNRKAVEDYLLHPVVHLEHRLFILCRYDMLNPSPAESSMRELRIEPVSALTISINEIEKRQPSFRDHQISEEEVSPYRFMQNGTPGLHLRLRHAIESLLPPS